MGKTFRKSADEMNAERRNKKAKKHRKGTHQEVPETNLFNRIKRDKQEAAREERREREELRAALDFGRAVDTQIHAWLDTASNRGVLRVVLAGTGHVNSDDAVEQQAYRELVGWYNGSPVAQSKFGLDLTENGFTLAKARQAAA